ncbi:hypothetical protein SKAU_G00160520 [Synaphobranchus kaupii]|uniref:Uncharacterized protein n=1 Tax=Synaphobranchus kaupii TaxID=118154 RepID=A0A9Q1FIE8_SYNKA|nr:hypothetical protein SKAU_G00160520 [Synaphobranchus kaupii]
MWECRGRSSLCFVFKHMNQQHSLKKILKTEAEVIQAPIVSINRGVSEELKLNGCHSVRGLGVRQCRDVPLAKFWVSVRS